MELSERISQAASAVGILAAALPDALARGERQFSLPPTDHELATWAQSLKTSAPHFFAPQSPPQPTPAEQARQAVLDTHPAERITHARSQSPPVVKQRRGPVSHAEAAAFAKMPVEEFNKLSANKRTDYARELQAQQQAVR